MAQTDVVVTASGGSIVVRGSHSLRPVQTAPGVWYWFFVDPVGLDLYWTKTTNYGVTWSTGTLVKAFIAGMVGVWFDKWTPGDTGTVIHLVYQDLAGGHDIFYRAFDTATDTLGTERTVFDGASAVQGVGCLSITKTRGPKIAVMYDHDGGTELGFSTSDDYPVTAFSAKTDAQEATADHYILMPGNYADANDLDCIFWDRSDDIISLKTYDNSANNWTGVSAETTIAASMTDFPQGTINSQFSAAVRTSDGHILLAAWTNGDTLNADLRFWDINGAASIVEKTNVVLNSVDDQAACAVAIDSSNNNIYVFYGGKSDGSETAYTALKIYYKVSADGGTTWGAETTLSTYARALLMLTACPRITGGEFTLVWGGLDLGVLSQITSAFLADAAGGRLGHPGMNGGMNA